MALAQQTPHRPAIRDLYETDFHRWLIENANMLRTGRLSEADLANIAEELDDMGRSERRALASHLGILLLHLLKWQFQPSHRSSSWRGSIYNARRSIHKLLSESPSLRNRIPELIDDEYRHAQFLAANETGLPESLFPNKCPYTVGQTLDQNAWPEQGDPLTMIQLPDLE